MIQTLPFSSPIATLFPLVQEMAESGSNIAGARSSSLWSPITQRSLVQSREVPVDVAGIARVLEEGFMVIGRHEPEEKFLRRSKISSPFAENKILGGKDSAGMYQVSPIDSWEQSSRFAISHT